MFKRWAFEALFRVWTWQRVLFFHLGGETSLVWPYFIWLNLGRSHINIESTKEYMIESLHVCILRWGFVIGSAQGLYAQSGRTSYRKISWNLEAARFGFGLFQSLWNLTCISAAVLSRCLSISERYDHYSVQSRGFDTSRDLAVRRLTA